MVTRTGFGMRYLLGSAWDFVIASAEAEGMILEHSGILAAALSIRNVGRKKVRSDPVLDMVATLLS